MKNSTRKIKISSKKTHSLTNFIVYIYAIIAPLSTTFLDRYNLVLIAIIFSIVFFIKLIKSPNYKINKVAAYFIFLYLMIFIFSSFGQIYSIYKITDNGYVISVISRILTISTCIITILLISDWAEKQNTNNLLFFLKASFFSTLIFAAFGIYQIIAYKYNLPFLETRSNVYGASHEIQSQLNFRLTSITREPNFYAPILLESILISIVVLNKRLFFLFLSLSLYLIFRTYSTGVYIHTAIIFALFFIFIEINKVYKLLILILILILIYAFTINELNTDFYFYFIEKLNSEKNGESFRVFVYLTVLNSIIDSNIINILFGHGVNSLQNFSDITGMKSLTNVSASNNLFLDVLWESGILGIITFFIGMFFIGKTIYSKKYYLKKCKYRYISFMLFLSVLVTSLYRSEYTTTHFSWVFCNIIILYIIAKKNSRKNMRK
ncbi:O-antigen ligase family protein [Xenorhabdus sp. KJ12.1]|uniref:O-antigen ligase family protein n=1 Tax=Xenorhabdus sp. KJ12.1 TaxID=1851571 RepID=UPI000C04B5F6|nr:O-antigen ligase family protein [Xenorhabdus sp. KJ12.1]PHM68339.1 hypothetical protein Xekj_03388 [Xenorhabdus sp. KJ12.1]